MQLRWTGGFARATSDLSPTAGQMATVTITPVHRSRWAYEARAMVVLAVPIVLTNLAQVALGATDVVMMGWLGPEALAAGALAVNLNYAVLIFALGVVTATATVIAQEVGRNRFAV